MTLYEYIQNSSDFEITVWDKDYDVETYFYKDNIEYEDDWDKAMSELSKLLTVVNFSKNGLTVNLAEIIEDKLSQLKEADLFYDCSIEEIMDDIDAILAGNVSERWLTEFVEILGRD